MSNSLINQHEFTVSEVSLALKSLLERNFSKIRVKGEISGLKIADSGHSYFSLKDEKSVLNAICWRHAAAKMKIKLEEGMEVVCIGSLSSYPSRSLYQMNIEEIEVSGIGSLLKLLAQRKEKLTAEGLFSLERKRAIPFLPTTIAVVTSPTGAVIKDIIHRIEDRFPLHIMIWGVMVQGPEAASQIAEAIIGLQDMPDSIPKPDVIIVARGGGSIEDLWPFNEEVVVRAVANSSIPLISAVGHETDTTLIDFAADKRAPTPTAAAEMAVPVRRDLINTIVHYYNRQLSALRNQYRSSANSLSQLSLRMRGTERIISQQQQVLDQSWHRLHNCMENRLAAANNVILKISGSLSTNLLQYKYSLQANNLGLCERSIIQCIRRAMNKEEHALEIMSGLLQSYNPQGVLKRGFAIIHQKSNLITTVKKIHQGDAISITMYDGEIESIVSSINCVNDDVIL